MEAERLLQLGPAESAPLGGDAERNVRPGLVARRECAGGTVARVVRGSKSQTAAALFDEMAAALQFPYYFGENWDALDECLNDLEWLDASGLILIFTEAERLLAREPAVELSELLDILEDAARSLGQSHRAARPQPFHAVFQSSPEEASGLSSRFERRSDRDLIRILSGSGTGAWKTVESD